MREYNCTMTDGLPPVVLVRQTHPQPAVDRRGRRESAVCGAGEPARTLADRACASPSASAAAASANLAAMRPRHGRRAQGTRGRSRSSSPRWAATAGPRPRASANCSPATASTEATWACRSSPTWTPSQIGTNSCGQPVWWDRNARGGRRRRHCLAASSRTPTSAAGSRAASSRCWSSAWASGAGRTSTTAGAPRAARHAARRRQASSLENTKFARRAGDPGERQRADGRTRGGRAATTCSTREPALLDEAAALMGRLPFDQIDVLVVGELRQELLGRRHRPERRRPAAESRRQPDFERRRRSRACACSTCRRRATATRPASASPT